MCAGTCFRVKVEWAWSPMALELAVRGARYDGVSMAKGREKGLNCERCVDGSSTGGLYGKEKERRISDRGAGGLTASKQECTLSEDVRSTFVEGVKEDVWRGSRKTGS